MSTLKPLVLHISPRSGPGCRRLPLSRLQRRRVGIAKLILWDAARDASGKRAGLGLGSHRTFGFRKGATKVVGHLRAPLSGTDRRLRPLCKKCRQTPILIAPVFPHSCLFPLLRTRRSGAVLGARDSVSAARVPLSGTDRCFPALCKKCRQTPILTLLVFLHTPRGGTARGGTLPRAGAQRPCCGGVEDGSTDAERPKEAGTGRVPRERAPTPLWI